MITLLFTLLFTLLSALYDNGKMFTNHTPRFIFRAIVVAVISYFEQGNFITNFLLNTAIFYSAFDYTLNLLEGRKWNYIGQTARLDVIKGEVEKIIPNFDVLTKILFFTIAILLKYIFN